MAWSTVSTPVSATAISTTAFGIPVAGNFAVLGNAWSTYTPTLSNLTLGNGTVTGRYVQVGKTIDFIIKFTLGSTSAVSSGASHFSLPATAQTQDWDASGTAFDTSGSVYYPIMAIAGSTTAIGVKTWPGTAGNNILSINATVPMTWATGDILTIRGRYEAA